jgi:DNA-binding MarR family transcriptional regulator
MLVLSWIARRELSCPEDAARELGLDAATAEAIYDDLERAGMIASETRQGK